MEYTRDPRPEKVAVVNTLAEKLESAKGVFLTDFSGLSVEQVTELRVKFRESNTEYLVVKNTLARFGAEKAGHDEIVPYFQGPIALAFSYDDPAAPARVLKDFLKKNPKPEVKACMIEGDVMPGENFAEIASWPTREELIAKVVGSLNSPISGVVMTLSAIQKNLLYALNAVAAKKEQG